MNYWTITSREVDEDGTTWNETTNAIFENYTEAKEEYNKLKKTANQIHWKDLNDYKNIKFNTTEWDLNKVETDEDGEENYFECIDTKRTTLIHTTKKDYTRNVPIGYIKDFEKDYEFIVREIKDHMNADYTFIDIF